VYRSGQSFVAALAERGLGLEPKTAIIDGGYSEKHPAGHLCGTLRSQERHSSLWQATGLSGEEG